MAGVDVWLFLSSVEISDSLTGLITPIIRTGSLELSIHRRRMDGRIALTGWIAQCTMVAANKEVPVLGPPSGLNLNPRPCTPAPGPSPCNQLSSPKFGLRAVIGSS